jgi:hypothetical protein
MTEPPKDGTEALIGAWADAFAGAKLDAERRALIAAELRRFAAALDALAPPALDAGPGVDYRRRLVRGARPPGDTDR